MMSAVRQYRINNATRRLSLDAHELSVAQIGRGIESQSWKTGRPGEEKEREIARGRARLYDVRLLA